MSLSKKSRDYYPKSENKIDSHKEYNSQNDKMLIENYKNKIENMLISDEDCQKKAALILENLINQK